MQNYRKFPINFGFHASNLYDCRGVFENMGAELAEILRGQKGRLYSYFSSLSVGSPHCLVQILDNILHVTKKTETHSAKRNSHKQ